MSQRGQPSKTKEQAPRRKTNSTKDKLQTSPGLVQEAHPQTTPVSKNGETPKAQNKSPQKTEVPGKKRKQTLIASQNKSTQNPCNTAGKKKTPKTQQRKN